MATLEDTRRSVKRSPIHLSGRRVCMFVWGAGPRFTRSFCAARFDPSPARLVCLFYDQRVHATYENGVLRPIEPLDLPENARV